MGKRNKQRSEFPQRPPADKSPRERVDVGHDRPVSAPHRGDALLLAGFLASGLAALGLELIWMRSLGLAFGNESFGMLGVLTGFFAGLALGAALFHRAVLRSRRPALIYIGAEAIVAAYALAGPTFIVGLADVVPSLIGPIVGDNRSLTALSLNLVIATLILAPATISMGATTVAGVEAWRRRRTAAENDSTVAWLYAANTLGATLGIACTIYWLMPALGVAGASMTLALFSVAGIVLVWRWERTNGMGAAETQAVPSGAVDMPPAAPVANGNPAMTAPSRRRLYALLFCTGLAGIGLETVGTHVLAQIFENTIHTFANILAVYLLGTAAGAWWYATRIARRVTGDRDRVTGLLLYGLAMAGVLAAVTLAQSAVLISALAPPGATYGRRMIAETVTATLVFVPPTVLMGATFSHLLGYFTREGIGLGSAFNTAGAALAPFVFGIILIPAAGYGVAFFCATGLYVMLFIAAGLTGRQPLRWVLAGIGSAAAIGALAYSSLILVAFPASVRLLAQRVGLQGVVSVAEGAHAPSPSGDLATRVLQVDQKQLMGGSPGFVTKRMGHLPMLIASSPRQVLYLGIGTGITAGSALEYPVERVTGVELLPEILDMLPWFGEDNHHLEGDPRVSLHASDARRFIRATSQSYDVIVADLYHPSRDGTGSLYTVEHFRNIRDRLTRGGVFVQWLPLYQLRADDLKTIIRTFLDVFPDADSMLGNYAGNARLALIGRGPGNARAERYGVDVPRDEVLLRPRDGRVPVFDGVPDLLASYMLDADALRRYAGAGALNTDVNQRIAFDAAGTVGDDESSTTHRSLASLLPYRRPFPDEFIRYAGPGGSEALRRNVGPYADAVTHYLGAEITRLDDSADPMPAAAMAEYFKAYEADVRFTLAIGKLLEYAIARPALAREIVQRLWTIHPEQPNMAALVRKLGGVDAPDRVSRIIAHFLQTGGDS